MADVVLEERNRQLFVIRSHGKDKVPANPSHSRCLYVFQGSFTSSRPIGYVFVLDIFQEIPRRIIESFLV